MLELPKDQDNQIRKYNQKCKNNFHINILKYLINNEFEVLKEEKTNEQTIYEEYKLNYENNNIVLTITKYQKEKQNDKTRKEINNKKITLKEKIKKKTLSTLIKETKNITEEELNKIKKKF